MTLLPDRLRHAAWPAPLAGLDPESRVLALAGLASIVLHGVILSIHFKLPEKALRLAPAQLEVIIVNSRTQSRPVKPDALAQANLDGGGNTEANRRAKSPLPVLRKREPGDDVRQAVRRVEELEMKQRELLAQLQAKPAVPVVEPPKAPVPEEPRPEAPRLPSGTELASRALMMARMEAQIARSVDEYSKRPRKQFVGARAAEARFAMYVEDWRQKVERIGSLNYPEGARGRIYGSLQLTVSINAEGSVVSIDLERSSGHKILDAAAQRIVQMGAPYARFPAQLRSDTDILVITRTWHFAPGDKVFSE